MPSPGNECWLAGTTSSGVQRILYETNKVTINHEKGYSCSMQVNESNCYTLNCYIRPGGENHGEWVGTENRCVTIKHYAGYCDSACQDCIGGCDIWGGDPSCMSDCTAVSLPPTANCENCGWGGAIANLGGRVWRLTSGGKANNANSPAWSTCVVQLTAPMPCPDIDGDGHTNISCGGDDCNDNNSSIYTGATELCDKIDNDCDGSVDEGCPDCGNNIIEMGEQCDSSQLGGQTCITKGFSMGNLSCNSTCGFNLSNCSTPPIASCGNNIIEGLEICDGTSLGGHSCQSDLGLSGNISCTSNCTLNTLLCSRCGNNITEGGEICDGTSLGGQACSSLGYTAGNLSCKSDCSDFNRSFCSLCGNSLVESGEECDRSNLNSKTCVNLNLGFVSGNLSCNSTCKFNVSRCIEEDIELCGNGIIDEDEECDGSNLTSRNCTSLGYGSGLLSCKNNCDLNISKCVVRANCTDSCVSKGYQCGTRLICGSYINCGSCASGSVCNASGRCIEQEIPSCTDTCASLGYECGQQTICGSSQDCGACDSGECSDIGICKGKSRAWIWIIIIILVLAIIAIAFFIIRKGNFSGFKKPSAIPGGPKVPPIFPAPNSGFRVFERQQPPK